MSYSSASLLFFEESLRHYLATREHDMEREVETQSEDYLLNVSVDDFVQYLVDKYSEDAPVLRTDEVYAHDEEVDVDISKNPMYGAYGSPTPYYIKGLAVTYHLPFEGNGRLLRYQAQTFSSNPPRATVANNELLVRFERPNVDPEEIKREWDWTRQSIEKHVGWTARDVARFNEALEAKARSAVEARREKLLSNRNVMAALGVPLRQRSDAATTYSVPNVRKKAAVSKPAATTTPFKPEPALSDAEYENILSIISRMSVALERSPETFAHMDEEQLRDFFLVYLNDQYEGRATGETFNRVGKTDILIRDEGKTIFIGECKIWKGPQKFIDTIDQILGYTSWRDTKTAILLFNRNKNLSAVLEQIPPLVASHPNFKRNLGTRGETEFRFRLHHSDDENRELTLAVLAFDVPSHPKR